MCPVNVSFSVPVARSQILIVLSPAPEANHWLPGSVARARTHPRCPEMTLKSFQGACQSGFCCRTVSLRTRLEEGVFLCGVGPFALGGAFDPAVPLILVRAMLVPSECACGCRSDTPSIILAICGSLACSSVFGFFRRAASPACAFACFCANAAGNSFTSRYSFRILEATLAFCVTS